MSRSSAPHSSIPTRRWIVAAAVVAVCAGVLVPALPGAAQANPVVVSTRTTPELPDAGDDVTVSVQARGCPPGGARVEIYLRTDDRSVASDALMVRSEVASTLFFRVSEEIELPDAEAGWYGVRVVCGQFRPDRGPMPNTWFRIGEPEPLPIEVGGDRVVQGQALSVSGEGCGGGELEYAFARGERRTSFVARSSIPVSPLGTFAAAVTFTPDLAPGPVTLRVRCSLVSPYGDAIWRFYDSATVEVVAP